jgi:Notch-like protein
VDRGVSRGIPLNIHKISMPFILSPLVYICNKSLSLGIFPTRLKYSEVSPIFKKGDGAVTSNYRPISLLTSFSKNFEKVIFNRIKPVRISSVYIKFTLR